jgi:hypothetical protein
MDKIGLQRQWARLRQVQPWWFLVLAVVSALVCVAALRANNLRMISLREAVYEADRNNGDVEGSLRALREHVYGHMNTDLASGPNAVRPPIQLKFTYERLMAERQAAAGTSNSVIYTEAQQYCEKAFPASVSGGGRVECIQNYVKQRQPAAAPSVPRNLYQFDFVSPRWSPDLAGWSMVISVVSLLTALGLWLWRNVVRHLLNR